MKNNFKIAVFLLMTSFANLAWAQIEIRTNIRDIYVAGTLELPGAIAFFISDDEFPSASVSSPVYLRVTLESEAVLAHTLVAPTPGQGAPPPNHYICLAAALRQAPTVYRNNISIYAIAIVRWVAGEHSFWIKITQPTSTWVLNIRSLEEVPPTPDYSVTFYVGLSAQENWNSISPYYNTSHANLPVNTRVPINPILANGASTQIMVDVSQSILTAYPDPNNLLRVNYNAYDEFTYGVLGEAYEDDIVLGNPIGTIFQGDTGIARARELADMPFIYIASKWRVWQISVLDLVVRIRAD